MVYDPPFVFTTTYFVFPFFIDSHLSVGIAVCMTCMHCIRNRMCVLGSFLRCMSCLHIWYVSVASMYDMCVLPILTIFVTILGRMNNHKSRLLNSPSPPQLTTLSRIRRPFSKQRVLLHLWVVILWTCCNLQPSTHSFLLPYFFTPFA